MIYFIHATGTDFVKIGFTAGDPAKRLKELQTGCPHKLDLLAATDGSEADEARWHKDFADDRANGEWFKLTPRLMAAVCKAKPGPSAPRREPDRAFVLSRGENGFLDFYGVLVDDVPGDQNTPHPEAGQA